MLPLLTYARGFEVLHHKSSERGLNIPLFLQIIVKEKGIFSNVTSPSTKAKLRLAFEVAPLGLLIENAGGYSSNGEKSVLDIPIGGIDDRTQVSLCLLIPPQKVITDKTDWFELASSGHYGSGLD